MTRLNMPMTRDHAARVLRDAGAEESDIARLLGGPANLRDDFAGMAMREHVRRSDPQSMYSQASAVGKYAYAVADAMLAARGGAR